MTRCNLLPVLTGTEETALFTCSRLLPVSKLLRVTPGDLISNVSDQISVTWDVQIDPDELDLRWHDSSGDTFVLSTPSTLATCLVSIDLNGADNRTRALCSQPGLSLISSSRTSCVSVATEPFLLDTCHRLRDRLKTSLTHFVNCCRFSFFLVALLSFGCPIPSLFMFCHFSSQYDKT